jgi:hypothetical protein
MLGGAGADALLGGVGENICIAEADDTAEDCVTDQTAPVVTTLVVEPSDPDMVTGLLSISTEFTLEDIGSGVDIQRGVEVDFTTADGTQNIDNVLAKFIAGNAKRAMFRAETQVPLAAETVEWEVASLAFFDLSGNASTVTTESLAASGFAAKVTAPVLVPVITKPDTDTETKTEAAIVKEKVKAAKAAATAIAISVTAAVAATAAASGAAAAASGAASGGSAGSSAARAAVSGDATADAADAAAEAADNAADAGDAGEGGRESSELDAAARPGDSLALWSSGLVVALDEPSRRLTKKVAPVSPLSSKLFNDAAYLRAAIGSFSAALPITAIIFAVLGIMQTGNQVVPPPTALLVGILLIGAFDVFAAVSAMLVFSVGALMKASSPDVSDVRLLIVLTMVSFGPSMLAGAFRSFRRPAARSGQEWYERVIDLAVGAFIAGWATQNLINVLTPVSGRLFALTEHASRIGAIMAVAVTLRVVAEEVVARYFPGRLSVLDVHNLPPARPLQVNISLTLRALFFGFLMDAFFGHGILLFIGTALFILPAFLGPLSDRLPNLPKLYQILPTGLPALAFGMFFAATMGALFASHMPSSMNTGALTFVGATGASALIGFLGLFGREPAEGDVYWYMRPQNKWIYRIGGVAIFLVTLRVTGFV